MNFLSLDPVAFRIGDAEVRWYAIFILTGALIAYFTIREIVGKKGYSKDMVDTLFVTCFPVGILCARLWWCLWDVSSPFRDEYLTFFQKIAGFFGFIGGSFEGFAGLAIQGGVIGGVLCGIIIMRKKYKEVPLMFVVDSAVPNILIAQAIGRWGNFMNLEVFGRCVDPAKLNFLPKFIVDQMIAAGATADAACEVGQAVQPLFLYESIANIIGWILIVFVLRIFWKSRKPGDLMACYFLWYGSVRAIMEPLRNASFIMNGAGAESIFTSSFVTSLVFILFAISYFVFIRIYLKKKEINNK